MLAYNPLMVQCCYMSEGTPHPSVPEAPEDLSQSPPRIDPVYRTVARPLVNEVFVDVPATPLFVENLPTVDRIMDYSIGTDTRGRTTETLMQTSADLVRYSYKHSEQLRKGEIGAVAVKIAASGAFPHQRSINWMEAEDTVPESIVVQGKEYSGISTKGADYYLPRIVFDEHYPVTHARINGLMTADFARRTVDVSNWLLKEGINSEVVWSVSRPERFPWTEVTEKDGLTSYTREKELLSTEEFKGKLLERARRDNTTLPSSRRIDLDRMEQYLKETDLVVVNRATTVPFRLSDLPVPFGEERLPHTSPKAEFVFMLNRMFAYLNQNRPAEQQFRTLQRSTKQSSSEEKAAITKANDEEITKFFDYFADNLGQQVGTLHKKGVAHGFLHAGNITADGTFVDIDSLHGSPLGDREITQENIIRDVAWAMRAIRNAISELIEAGVLPEDAAEDINVRFLKRYATVRWSETPHTAISGMDRLIEGVGNYVPEEDRAKKSPAWYNVPDKISDLRKQRALKQQQRWTREKIAAPLHKQMTQQAQAEPSLHAA